jgi:hypothetical protein
MGYIDPPMCSSFASSHLGPLHLSLELLTFPSKAHAGYHLIMFEVCKVYLLFMKKIMYCGLVAVTMYFV